MYGLTPSVHHMKVNPWVVRLQAGTAALDQAIAEGDSIGVVSGIEDVSFWTGRIICDVIGSHTEALSDRSTFRQAVESVAVAQEAIVKGRHALESVYGYAWGEAPSTPAWVADAQTQDQAAASRSKNKAYRTILLLSMGKSAAIGGLGLGVLGALAGRGGLGFFAGLLGGAGYGWWRGGKALVLFERARKMAAQQTP